jgi:hypothetical protein
MYIDCNNMYKPLTYVRFPWETSSKVGRIQAWGATGRKRTKPVYVIMYSYGGWPHNFNVFHAVWIKLALILNTTSFQAADSSFGIWLAVFPLFEKMDIYFMWTEVSSSHSQNQIFDFVLR